MFTISQIKEAHSKVKSGADFPTFIRELKNLGVISYESFVTDGHTSYLGQNDFQATAPGRDELLSIAANPDPESFKSDLILHQQGKTDYLTFCRQCAKHGIAKWKVELYEMTCTYFDISDNTIHKEQIPA